MEELTSIIDFIQTKPDHFTIFMSLMISLAFSFVMWLAYKMSHTQQEYKEKFAVTIVSLAIISTVLMDLIQSNLALSLGMLGSLSIVRFRTNIKDPRDIGFIFWSMAIGIASATQSYIIGVFGSIVLFVLMVVTKKNNTLVHTMLLVVRGSECDLDMIQGCIQEYAKQSTLKAKNILSNSFEIVYEVEIDERKENQIINEMFGMEGIDSINLLAQNNQI